MWLNHDFENLQFRINYECTADSHRAGNYFFYEGKHIIGGFRGVFRRGEDFFYPQIVLSAAKGNFGVK